MFDKAKHTRNEYFIFRRRAPGFSNVRTLSNENVNRKENISCKKLKLLEALLEACKEYLTGRRNAFPLRLIVFEVGVSCVNQKMKENEQEGRKEGFQTDVPDREANQRNQLDYHLYGLSKRGKIIFFASICAFMLTLFGVFIFIAAK